MDIFTGTITKRRVLEEMLERYNAEKRCFSAHMRNQSPAEGFEAAYYITEKKMDTIRQMMRDLEQEEVKKNDKEAEAVPFLRKAAEDGHGQEVPMVANPGYETGGLLAGILHQS